MVLLPINLNIIYKQFLVLHNLQHLGLFHKLIKNIKGQKEIGLPAKSYASVKTIVSDISDHINAISHNVTAMVNERKKANKQKGLKSAELYCNKVKPFFEEIRYHCDKLETMVDDNLWPLTKYRELLFTR